jgi:hypothetical protein
MMNYELIEDVLEDLTLPKDVIFNGSFFSQIPQITLIFK